MSLEVESIFHYVFVWHALSDACKDCQILDGREWRDQDLFQDVLWDMFYGNIWDLNINRSLMHGASGTCRCQLEVRIEKIEIEKLDSFQDFVNVLETWL